MAYNSKIETWSFIIYFCLKNNVFPYFKFEVYKTTKEMLILQGYVNSTLSVRCY